MEAVAARCSAWLLPHVAGYVWQRDPLALHASSRQRPPWWDERRRPGGGAARRPAAAGAGACWADGILFFSCLVLA